MSQSIFAIPKVCATQSGVEAVVFTLPSNIATPPTTALATTLDFVDPDEVYAIAFSRNTAKYTMRTRADRGGDIYEGTLQAFIPRRRVEMDTLMFRVRNRRVHAIYTDRDSNQRIVWNARALIDYTSGDRRGTPNGYTIRFNHVHAGHVPIISGNEDLPLPPGGGDQPESCCIIINPSALGYYPPPSGNVANLNKVVTAPDGTVFFIDKNGLAIVLGRPAPDYFSVQVPDGETQYIATPVGITLPNPADYPFPTYIEAAEMSKRIWVKRERQWLKYQQDFTVDFAQQRIYFNYPYPDDEFIEVYIYQFPL